MISQSRPTRPVTSDTWQKSFANFVENDQSTIDDEICNYWTPGARSVVAGLATSFGNYSSVANNGWQSAERRTKPVPIPKRPSPSELAAEGQCDGWDPLLPGLAEIRKQAPIFKHLSRESRRETKGSQANSPPSSTNPLDENHGIWHHGASVSTESSEHWHTVESTEGIHPSSMRQKAKSSPINKKRGKIYPRRRNKMASSNSINTKEMFKRLSELQVTPGLYKTTSEYDNSDVHSDVSGSDQATAGLSGDSEAEDAENVPAPFSTSHQKTASQKTDGDSAPSISSVVANNCVSTPWSELLSRLILVLGDKSQYKQLLALRGSRAQRMIDLLQTILNDSTLPNELRRVILAAMQRLSKTAELYPTSFKLDQASVKWRVDDFVTSGTFGDIYKGQYEGKLVCIKMIRPVQIEGDQIQQLSQRFAQEAVLWGQLSHPNVLPFYGSYRYSSRPCLISPWMTNGDINKYVKNNPSVNRYLLVSDILKGLDYLHSYDIIHGDLKGVNILVNAAGIACLADFGISSIFDESIPHWTTHSTVASKGGTRRWQAPELFDFRRDDKEVYNTPSSDVYAWACVCYEIFTGQPPFYEIKYNEAVVFKVLQDGAIPTRPSDDSVAWTGWGLTKFFWDLMARCWLRDPEARPRVQNLLLDLLEATKDDNRPMGGAIQVCGDFARKRGAVCSTSALPSVTEIDQWLGTR